MRGRLTHWPRASGAARGRARVVAAPWREILAGEPRFWRFECESAGEIFLSLPSHFFFQPCTMDGRAFRSKCVDGRRSQIIVGWHGTDRGLAAHLPGASSG